MSARYGSRTRTGEAVSGFGQRGAGGAALSEVTFTASPSPAAPSTPVTIGGEEYIVVSVNANTTLTFSAPATATYDAIIVAGGGGGGDAPSSANGAGGGGAGGVRVLLGQTIPSSPTPFTIGAGGAGATSGNPTTGFGVTTTGGGRGGPSNNAGLPGGSGGGSGTLFPANGPGTTAATAVFTPGVGYQGYPGGYSTGSTTVGGGGGGASGGGFNSAGNRPGLSGGAGIYNFLPGATTPYQNSYLAGGGGGGNYLSYFPGGGAGGGGYGSMGDPPSNGNSGATNTGGGGGGGAGGFPNPGGPQRLGLAGGSGVVKFRYKRFQA